MDSKIDSKSNISTLSTLSSHKDRKHDTIPFRLDFIKILLEGKELDNIIYDKTLDTEAFINPYSSSDDEKTKDTKYVLNKKLKNFYSVINKLGGKLQYVKSGTTGHTFKGIISSPEGGNLHYGVKVVAYPKRERYGNMYNIDRPENAELMMIRLLSYFVVKKQTPHIILPIATFNTDIKPFVSLIENSIVPEENRKYKEFIERYKKGDYFNTVSILVSEWANKGDLLDYLRNNYKQFTPMCWKVIFFQLISVLAVIQSKYPSFRHNDLKANNVLLHKVVKKKSCYSYKVNGQKFKIPSIGYQIKIWDFDFACIPDVVNNSKVSDNWTTKINVNPEQNRYYDMHYFFNTLIKKGFFPQFMLDPEIPKESKDFVNRIVPKKYQKGQYVSDKGRILINKEYLIPRDVLMEDPYFDEFRVKDIDTQTQASNKILTTSNYQSDLKINPKIDKIIKTKKSEHNRKVKKIKIESSEDVLIPETSD
uniref:Protein kinase domain-containing protein n=1 Tax=viral metagenome TaxID=1070528 RepID=A0A6C0ACG2_9ZZZZ